MIGVLNAPPPPPRLRSPQGLVPPPALPPRVSPPLALVPFRPLPLKHLESPTRSATPTRSLLQQINIPCLRRCMDPEGGVDRHLGCPRLDFERKRTSSYNSAIINTRKHFIK